MRNKKIGNVFEFPIPSGLAYFQYLHRIPMWGGVHLIRVLAGRHKERPTDLARLVAMKEQFTIISFMKNKDVNVELTFLGNYNIPEKHKTVPEYYKLENT